MRFVRKIAAVVRWARSVSARLRPARNVSTVVCALGIVVVGLPPGSSPQKPEPDHEPIAEDGAPPRPAVETRLSDQEIQQLVVRLDSSSFESRNAATRDLIGAGSAAVPFLVDALSEKSRELRFRATELLSHCYSFDDVAPQLVAAMARQEVPVRMRTILRDQAEEQIDAACQWSSTARLFKFWGTDPESFRKEVLGQFDDTRTHQEVARTIQPLLGLEGKVTRFADVMARLEALSLPYEHQFSAGHVVARSLAQGLHDNNHRSIEFATKYIEAFEALVNELRHREEPTHAIRKEISDRANMSQGAADYLVKLTNNDSVNRSLLSQRLGVSVETLQDEFFRGLASPEAKLCSRNVGKVHIADMLTEALNAWPSKGSDDVLWQIVADAKATVISGDKPKALAYLDALAACRELAEHPLGTGDGFGRQLAQRLHQASVESADIRTYHPARSVHDRILALVDMGIAPDHALFPRRFCDRYLEGDAQVTSDSHRLALERYLRSLEHLRDVDPQYEQPAVERFLLVLQGNLLGDHDVVAAGASELSRLLKQCREDDGKVDAKALILGLNAWAEPMMGESRTSKVEAKPDR